ncbi:hypothetical protein [Demequina sp. NBRC 110057]|uniref:hypothetical protein n=1 Tax=Demequina sp. NBRC 110057 TaxID=1570346 RepID=UPI000A06A092|nr:hypothetical protein [Demequina sp. NBRC 110057]
MKIQLDQASKGRGDDALQPVSVTFESGAVTLVRAETEQRPTVLGLLASGRMDPDTGAVRLDGREDRAGMRARVALIDAPAVSEPPAHVSTVGIVEEELMFAGRLATIAAARRTLDEWGLSRWTRTPIGNVDPTDRIRLLLTLAAMRPGVEGVVLVAPDRHGGDPAGWWEECLVLARAGLAVLVIAGDAAAATLAGTSVAQMPDTLVAYTERDDEEDER